MKILQINSFGNLSTGNIAVDICRLIRKSGNDGIVAFSRNTVPKDIPFIKIGNKKDLYIHTLMTRITDRTGFFSKSETRKLISKIVEYNPDIIHLHNLHGYYINIEILFEFLKKTQIPVVWTLHDCWSYTGHCCYYNMVNCDKWKYKCSKCPQKRAYPASFLLDSSTWNYNKKKNLFSDVNMTIVTVSKWLENEVRHSFLSNYPIKTIYNGINLEVFRPRKSSFRDKYSLKQKKIILGVASTWSERKGLSDFIKLAEKLDNRYRIVLVGIPEKEKKILPENIIGLEKTVRSEELAEIYTAADIYFNASVEETFGLTTVEALACGTPVIVYNSTALPEVVKNNSGYVVPPHDLDAVKECIEKCNPENMRDYCLASASKYNKTERFKEYIKLYESLC